MTREENLYYSLFCKFTPGIGNIKGVAIVGDETKLNRLPLNSEPIKANVEKELTLIEKLKLKTVTFFDEDYPEKLKHIHNPPLILYYYGILPTNFSFGIVGTRTPSKYGVSTTQMIASQLCAEGITIVSGFAYGVDALAHETCLQNNSPTVAVLGSGIDVQYPQQNIWMRRQIVEKGGAIISEFPIGTYAKPSNFPIRNRIISGLSDAVLIVEAGIGSGSLITAKMALEQGKNIYTIPGTIFGDSFRGNHHLIRLGATLIEDGYQALKEFREFDYLNKKSIGKIYKTQAKGKKEPINTFEKTEKEVAGVTKQFDNKDFYNTKQKEKDSKNAILKTLTSDETVVYYTIEKKTSFEEIVLQTSFTTSKTLGLLTALILKGLIGEEGGFYFAF